MPDAHSVSTKGSGSSGSSARPAVLAAITTALALAAVVVIAVLVGGQGRDDFKDGSVAELTKALEAKQVAVCSTSSPDPGTGEGGSISRQVLRLALPGKCGDAIDLRVDGYADQAHRDAAARNAEAQERQRNYGVVYTWHRYTLYLQADDASADSELRDRIVDALDSVGAQ